MQEVRGSIPLISIAVCEGGGVSDLGLDPDLLALLQDTPQGVPSEHSSAGKGTAMSPTGTRDPSDVDLSERSFPLVTEFQSKTPHQFFESAEFYKRVVSDELEVGQRAHAALARYLSTTDLKDRSVCRQQLISSYWQLMAQILGKIGGGSACMEKRYALRYGLLLPTLLTASQKDIFARIIETNSLQQPLYYLDEWLIAIGSGKVRPSSTDEVQVKRKDDVARVRQAYDKACGQLQSSERLLQVRSAERARVEEEVKNRISRLFVHESIEGLPGVTAGFNEAQKQGISEIHELLKKLLGIDREFNGLYAGYRASQDAVHSLREKLDAPNAENSSAVSTEYDTVRQMIKMSCGRQGNHFPLLSREYFRSAEHEIGTRENVLKIMAWIEGLDPEAYCRQYKQQVNRIPPFVVLLPSYGDIGFCWEPFDRYNRVTSRGRVAVPMYGRSLKLAVITATADLRWQVAKEKASYYWMEEGLTGNYYQWFQPQKLRGDVKEYFIADYTTWLLKESEGIQKLDKEVRNVFWRYIPFPQKIKDELKTKSFVYQELCQKDANRQVSDGY